MSARFSAVELDRFAETHLRYEAAMLVAEASEFHSRNPNGMPPRDGFKNPPIDDALLEATLVHLRLLDDFLGSKGGNPLDLRANDWVPQQKWKPARNWLTVDVRRRINAQVAYLSVERGLWFEWDIRAYAFACCEQLSLFVEGVRQFRPDRAQALATVEECAEDGIRRLAPAPP